MEGGAALGKAHQLHDKIDLEEDLSDALHWRDTTAGRPRNAPCDTPRRCLLLVRTQGRAAGDVASKDIRAIADEVENS